MSDKLPKGRYIICLRLDTLKGKTQTLVALANRLLPQSSQQPDWINPADPPPVPLVLKPTDDICVEVWIRGKHIGLNSHGDLISYIKRDLTKLAEDKCDIIFCACQSEGKTLAAVEDVARKFDYTIIWTAPYYDNTPSSGAKQPPSPFQNALNKLKAEHLEGLLEAII
jgi:hypothetical protein